MRTTITLDDETNKIVEDLMVQNKFQSLSALVRHAIRNMKQSNEKLILQEIREIKQLLKDQDEPVTPPRRRRKHLSYEEFSDILDDSSEEDQEAMNKLCKDNPEHWDRYLAENR